MTAASPASSEAGSEASDKSHGHSWCDTHSNRVVQLLAEWLTHMQRLHGLLVRVGLFVEPEARRDGQAAIEWRPVPGPAALRAREEGRLRRLPGSLRLPVRGTGWRSALPQLRCGAALRRGAASRAFPHRPHSRRLHAHVEAEAQAQAQELAEAAAAAAAAAAGTDI